jgi:hypothetical protein
LLVTALALAITAALLAGCSHDKALEESPEQIAKEQAAADAHNADTVPFAGDDESPSLGAEGGPPTTAFPEYQGAENLRIGDCVDIPKYNAPTVRVVPCTAPHHVEVTARIDLLPRFGLQYPTEEQFDSIRDQDCTRFFEAYTGHSETADVVAGQLVPTPEGWNTGDHNLTCVAEPANNREGNILTGSVRKVD